MYKVKRYINVVGGLKPLEKEKKNVRIKSNQSKKK